MIETTNRNTTELTKYELNYQETVKYDMEVLANMMIELATEESSHGKAKEEQQTHRNVKIKRIKEKFEFLKGEVIGSLISAKHNEAKNSEITRFSFKQIQSVLEGLDKLRKRS